MTNPVTERLLALVVEQTGMSREEVLAAIENPEWPERGPSRAWLDYVSVKIREEWANWPVDSRIGILLLAHQLDQEAL